MDHKKEFLLLSVQKMKRQNLEKNVPLWLNQDFHNFELLIVDDSSTDKSAQVLNSYSSDKRLKHIYHKSNNNRGGKKAALQFGIQQAKNELVILSDADCSPASNQWITHMTKALGHNKVVLGVGSYAQNKNNILSSIIQYETTLTYMQYLTAAALKQPYAGVGRNLLYHKSLFSTGFP